MTYCKFCKIKHKHIQTAYNLGRPTSSPLRAQSTGNIMTLRAHQTAGNKTYNMTSKILHELGTWTSELKNYFKLWHLKALAWWLYLMIRQCKNTESSAIQSLSSEMGSPLSLLRSCQMVRWSHQPTTTQSTRYELLTATYVKSIITFWNIMPCDLVHRYLATKLNDITSQTS